MALISVADAARRYGLSGRRIRELLQDGRIKGQRFGTTWAVDEKSVKAYAANPPKRGPRPKTP